MTSFAQAQVALGTGFHFGHVGTGAGTSRPDAAAGSLAAEQTRAGAGFATSTPAGGLAAGVGASAGQSNSVSGAASIGNGAAATGGFANNVGLGVGFGLARP